ncbi:molybdate ABC transporter substrate-binding protein [Allorhizobium sp. BGMRC 0089]|nr:molybdate ABC transporter substrate-binding protein [Allorhizobium sonneratiae]MCM2294551.1 molybdate ABC transporter substrate-binding protein [Allorhizobium sonneratiae]
MRLPLLRLVLSALLALAWPLSALAADGGVTVFAAASLKETMTAIAAQWKEKTGHDVRLSFAGSSALAKQIDQGAPADLFISADLDWMDHLDKEGTLQPGTRINLLGNRLVLIAPASSKITAEIKPGLDLAGLLKGGRLAMASVNAVPAGIYGKAALEKLGLWASVQDKIAQAENVRAALALVARGEAPLGIVYETDARVDPDVKVVDRFPVGSHPPIVYPAALLKTSSNPEAKAFLTYLQSDAAREIFTKAGFTVLDRKS